MRPRLMLYNPTLSTNHAVNEMTSQKGKMLEVRNHGNPTLNRAKSLIKLTDSVLGRDRSLAVRNAWVDELIAWADENNISEKDFPRNADEILELKSLSLTFFGAAPSSSLTSALSFIPNSIGNLTNLEYLNLVGNNLSGLPASIGSLANLRLLFMESNGLSALPESIGNLTNLRSLGLRWNKLSVLPDSIWNLNNLSWLFLTDNNLSFLPASIGNLTNLTELHLEGNKSLELPDALGNLENLERLVLSIDQVLPPSLAHLEPIVDWVDPD